MRFTLVTEKKLGLSAQALKKISEALAKHLPQKGYGEVLLTPLSAAKIRKLNRDWRGKNKVTDVLSFPQFSPRALPGALKKTSARKPLYLGDILLCLPYILRAAQRLKKPVNHHLTHLIVHGVLHLLGYDHRTARAAYRMEKLEKAILAQLGLPDPYAPVKGPKA